MYEQAARAEVSAHRLDEDDADRDVSDDLERERLLTRPKRDRSLRAFAQLRIPPGRYFLTRGPARAPEGWDDWEVQDPRAPPFWEDPMEAQWPLHYADSDEEVGPSNRS